MEKVGRFLVEYPVPFPPEGRGRKGTALVECYKSGKRIIAVACSDPRVLEGEGVENYKGQSITNSFEHLAGFLLTHWKEQGITPDRVVWVEFWPDRDDLPQSYDLVEFKEIEETPWGYKVRKPRWRFLWKAEELGAPVDHAEVLQRIGEER